MVQDECPASVLHDGTGLEYITGSEGGYRVSVVRGKTHYGVGGLRQ